MSGGNQSLQIIIGPFYRNAAHRNIIALMLAAFGQNNAKRAGRYFGIVEKQLVKIPHPVKQQGTRIGRLDFNILRHHRRDRMGNRAWL